MTARREPPTANAPRDLSGLRDGASAAADGLSPRELALFHAYRHKAPVMVEMPCACGGVIRATFGDWAGIAVAVRCHQELLIHEMWRSEWAA